MVGPLARAVFVAALVFPLAACSSSSESTAPRTVIPDPPQDPVSAIQEAEYREHFDAGLKALEAKNTDGAIAHLERAAGAKPRSAEAHMNLARAYAAKKDDEKALKAYADAVSANPRLGDAYFESAALLERMGRLEDARQEYVQLIREELSPKLTARAYWLRGDLADRLGKRTEYRYDREQAMKLDFSYTTQVKGGDVLVSNNTGTAFTLKVEQYETADGTAGTLPKDYEFRVPGNTSAYLIYKEKHVSARSIRFTITANEKSKSYTATYTKGMSLEVPINESDIPR